jgi:hypothetical protein
MRDRRSCPDALHAQVAGRMKILITLGVLQTIGIVVLILHALNTDDHVPREQQTRIPGTAISPTDMRAQHGSAALLADEERLRKIVREELTPLLAQRIRQAKPAAAERERNESEDRRRSELIAQQIETYRAVGSITDQQMQELQAGIAELDEASRKQMMSRLIRSLNSGELEGRL